MNHVKLESKHGEPLGYQDKALREVAYSLLFPSTEILTGKEHFMKKVGHWRNYKHRKIKTDIYSQLGHLKDIRKMY